MKCSLTPSRHAFDKMISFGFTVEEIIEAILKGAKRFEDAKNIATYKGFEVVYKNPPCHYYIIIVYWKR